MLSKNMRKRLSSTSSVSFNAYGSRQAYKWSSLSLRSLLALVLVFFSRGYAAIPRQAPGWVIPSSHSILSHSEFGGIGTRAASEQHKQWNAVLACSSKLRPAAGAAKSRYVER